MPIVISSPAASDEEMVFRTFRGYLTAICNWTNNLYPHSGGLLPGVAREVKTRPWVARTPRGGRRLSLRAAEMLRNGWATEVLLNSPRVLGGDELISFANLWAPVQAYYAIFEAFSALAMTVTRSKPPKTHAALLAWAATNIAYPGTPFVPPWTARVSGCPGAWTFEGFGGVMPNVKISNLAAPNAVNAPHLLGLALKTTREEQISDHRENWRHGLKTKAGKPRKNLPSAVLAANARAMRATTLFDLLWRLRVRSNYKEGDALLSGALGPADAAAFHDALSDIVAATMMTTEIFLCHLVGRAELGACTAALPIPSMLARHSVLERVPLW
jgi:hypothetical protein